MTNKYAPLQIVRATASTLLIATQLLLSAHAATLSIHTEGNGDIAIASPVSKISGNTITCKDGSSVTLSLIPNDGYVVDSVKLNDEYQIVSGDGTIEFQIRPIGDNNLTISFSKKPSTTIAVGEKISLDSIDAAEPEATVEPTPNTQSDMTGIGDISEPVTDETPKAPITETLVQYLPSIGIGTVVGVACYWVMKMRSRMHP